MKRGILNAFYKFLQAPVRSAWVEWVLVLVDHHHRHRRHVRFSLAPKRSLSSSPFFSLLRLQLLSALSAFPSRWCHLFLSSIYFQLVTIMTFFSQACLSNNIFQAIKENIADLVNFFVYIFSSWFLLSSETFVDTLFSFVAIIFFRRQKRKKRLAG